MSAKAQKKTPADLWKEEAQKYKALADGLNAEGTKLRQQNLELIEAARFAVTVFKFNGIDGTPLELSERIAVQKLQAAIEGKVNHE